MYVDIYLVIFYLLYYKAAGNANKANNESILHGFTSRSTGWVDGAIWNFKLIISNKSKTNYNYNKILESDLLSAGPI